MRNHPAKYSKPILKAAAAMLDTSHERIFDPMCGVGGIKRLASHLPHPTHIVGMELEHEWAAQWDRAIVGSILDPTPRIWRAFAPWGNHPPDAIVTSPTYGNRMADHHTARDKSRRLTYRHQLGRPLHEDNSGKLQWGKRYRTFHEQAWAQCYRLVRPGGRLIIDVRDHIRLGVRQQVAAWHLNTLLQTGWQFHAMVTVDTPGMGYGAHAKTRAGGTIVMAVDKPAP